jgi:hypothetical protein
LIKRLKYLENNIETFLFEQLQIENTDNNKSEPKNIFKLVKFSNTKDGCSFLLGNLPSNGFQVFIIKDVIKCFNKRRKIGKTIELIVKFQMMISDTLAWEH